MTGFAERLERLEDRAELQDLIVRYFLAADGDDLDGLWECFAADATFSVSGEVGGAGRDAVIGFLVEQRRRMGLTLHTPNHTLATAAVGDEAEGLVGAHVELVLDGVMIFGAVRYRDRYVREDGRWRIAARDMRVVHLAPWSEVGEAMASALPVRWPGAAPMSSDFPRAGA